MGASKTAATIQAMADTDRVAFRSYLEVAAEIAQAEAIPVEELPSTWALALRIFQQEKGRPPHFISEPAPATELAKGPGLEVK